MRAAPRAGKALARNKDNDYGEPEYQAGGRETIDKLGVQRQRETARSQQVSDGDADGDGHRSADEGQDNSFADAEADHLPGRGADDAQQKEDAVENGGCRRGMGRRDGQLDVRWFGRLPAGEDSIGDHIAAIRSGRNQTP